MNNFRYFILFTFYFNLITAKIQAMRRKGLRFRKVLKERRFPGNRNSVLQKNDSFVLLFIKTQLRYFNYFKIMKKLRL
jgi:hypothetical protein